MVLCNIFTFGRHRSATTDRPKTRDGQHSNVCHSNSTKTQLFFGHSNLTQTMNSEQSLEGWSKIEWPLVEKIISQIQLLVRWQNDFAKQQASELRKVLSGLGIWIWIIASLVLVFVLVIALFFAKRISDTLRKLRAEVNNVIREQNNHKIRQILYINLGTSQLYSYVGFTS